MTIIGCLLQVSQSPPTLFLPDLKSSFKNSCYSPLLNSIVDLYMFFIVCWAQKPVMPFYLPLCNFLGNSPDSVQYCGYCPLHAKKTKSSSKSGHESARPSTGKLISQIMQQSHGYKQGMLMSIPLCIILELPDTFSQ